MKARRRNRSKTTSGLALAIWLVLCAVSGYHLMAFDFRPGALGSGSGEWPGQSALPRRNGLHVVAFLHPRCDCSEATVTQLIRTIHERPGAALTVAAFVPPGGEHDPVWTSGKYVDAIRAAVPAASIVEDLDGAEARRFGALTSGTILVYDGGRELFRGGITNRRGGMDDNPGRRELASVLTGGRKAGASTPVFGCSIVPPAGGDGMNGAGAS